MIAFDIETGPLPEDQLLARMPEFDPSEVKVGNRGPEKAAELIESKRQSYVQDYFAKAALSATTGRVLTIGFQSIGSDKFHITQVDEISTLESFWHIFESKCLKERRLLAGWNIFEFDLPFILQRCWILGVPVNWDIWSDPARLFWNPILRDLMKLWVCGQRKHSKLTDVATQLLGEGKEEESGEHFHVWWMSDRPRALEYLRRDLDLTSRLAATLLETR